MEHNELLVSVDLDAIAARINGTHDLLDEIKRLGGMGIDCSGKVDAMRQRLTVERDELLDRYMRVSEAKKAEPSDREYYTAELAKLDPSDSEDRLEIAWISEFLASDIEHAID